MPNTWISEGVREPQDGGLGKVGYEINFNRYFYRYVPPRPLAEIEADIRALEKEIVQMLGEITRSGAEKAPWPTRAAAGLHARQAVAGRLCLAMRCGPRATTRLRSSTSIDDSVVPDAHAEPPGETLDALRVREVVARPSTP